MSNYNNYVPFRFDETMTSRLKRYLARDWCGPLAVAATFLMVFTNSAIYRSHTLIYEHLVDQFGTTKAEISVTWSIYNFVNWGLSKFYLQSFIPCTYNSFVYTCIHLNKRRKKSYNCSPA